MPANGVKRKRGRPKSTNNEDDDTQTKTLPKRKAKNDIKQLNDESEPKETKRSQLKSPQSVSSVPSHSRSYVDSPLFPSDLITTKSPPKVVKRRGRPSKVHVSETSFTLKEKKSFYDCITDNGFNVIYDMKKLSKALPERSNNEIKLLIDSFTRKGIEMFKRGLNDESQSNTLSLIPIEQWYDIIHQKVPANVKKDDLSLVFAEIFEEYSKTFEAESDDSSPNYGLIYLYLSEVLRGKCPPELEPIDALIIIQLLEELSDIIKNNDYGRQKEFLSSGKWNQSLFTYFNDIYLQRNNQSDDTPQEMNNRNDVDGDAQSLEANSNVSSVDEHLNLPKIRKISDSLNPIRVPIPLIQLIKSI